MKKLEVQQPNVANNKAPAPVQSKCTLRFNYAPSQDGIDLNLLILLHGLGDTMQPFANLGAKLKLPQTAILAVQAPEPVPYMEDSYQWHATFDFLTGELLPPANPDRMKTLMRTRKLMSELLHHLIDHSSFKPPNIYFFGFSQGGTVALDTVLFGDIRNLGGVVSISGYLLEEQRSDKPVGEGYPGYILITQGEKDPAIGKPEIAKKKYQVVQRLCSSSAQTSQVFIKNKGHTMPSSEGEWRVIHTFFSDHMARRNIQLENMSDVYLVNSSSS
ncbi:Alpha/Beta hydrolase protein [Radiomyces spectabilis]|uniref:Alpha/Beta hydrolase protein n=1 Tax=Radiomyces spectabilis TaxID=64574 RepID=UPI00221F5C1A|nr:Alpha/Beta hydrolase protein [Radiomyces spectabilis]KAI8368232.1 Alpha/Beta hydrolase protein [Radiomyces spectabilis]